MNIIIAGDGKVGSLLTRQLSSEGYDVTVFEALRQLNFPGLTDHGKMKHNSL